MLPLAVVARPECRAGGGPRLLPLLISLDLREPPSVRVGHVTARGGLDRGSLGGGEGFRPGCPVSSARRGNRGRLARGWSRGFGQHELWCRGGRGTGRLLSRWRRRSGRRRWLRCPSRAGVGRGELNRFGRRCGRAGHQPHPDDPAEYQHQHDRRDDQRTGHHVRITTPRRKGVRLFGVVTSCGHQSSTARSQWPGSIPHREHTVRAIRRSMRSWSASRRSSAVTSCRRSSRVTVG